MRLQVTRLQYIPLQVGLEAKKVWLMSLARSLSTCKIIEHLQDGQFTLRCRAHVLAGLYIQISKKDLKYVTHMRTTVMFFVMFFVML